MIGSTVSLCRLGFSPHFVAFAAYGDFEGHLPYGGGHVQDFHLFDKQQNHHSGAVLITHSNAYIPKKASLPSPQS